MLNLILSTEMMKLYSRVDRSKLNFLDYFYRSRIDLSSEKEVPYLNVYRLNTPKSPSGETFSVSYLSENKDLEEVREHEEVKLLEKSDSSNSFIYISFRLK